MSREVTNLIKSKKKQASEKKILWVVLMLFALIYQTGLAAQIIMKTEGSAGKLSVVFFVFFLFEISYFVVFKILLGFSFELEMLAVFFSSISLLITASVYPDKALVQLISIILGVCFYTILLWFLRDIKRISFFRVPAAMAAIGLLAMTLVIGTEVNGAKNWIFIGDFSIQPSEIAKVFFVFVGAVTLEKLQSMRSLTKYIAFSACCVGLLFLMYDFGTALIFFFTFILISFMRSGDIKKIVMICSAALVGAVSIVIMKPYVANRFMTYRRIWENMDQGGYQQTRVWIYSVSGGFFGVGIGEGKLRNIFAATEDLVFGILCEELGILTAFIIALSFLILVLYTLKASKTSPSTFYVIAACAASGMLLFQAALNIFGVTDLLPLTGVPLPFISRGGSSMLGSWGLLALIKSIDLRIYKNKYLQFMPYESEDRI